VSASGFSPDWCSTVPTKAAVEAETSTSINKRLCSYRISYWFSLSFNLWVYSKTCNCCFNVFHLCPLMSLYIKDMFARSTHWLIEHDLTSAPTQYRLYGRRFLQVKRPNQQYQSTEGNITKDKSNNKIHICTDNNIYKKDMGWLGDSSHRGQGRQARRWVFTLYSFSCDFQYFDTVGWVFWPVKTVSHITYTVLEGT